DGRPIRISASPCAVDDCDGHAAGTQVGYGIDLAKPDEAIGLLAHELIHQLHRLDGTDGKTMVPTLTIDPILAGQGQAFMQLEEARTTGVGPYQDAKLPENYINENRIRKEAGLEQRPTYYLAAPYMLRRPLTEPEPIPSPLPTTLTLPEER